MTILILCREQDLEREIAGYVEALRRRGVTLLFIPPASPINADISLLIQACPERPSLILHPESGFPCLPASLVQTQIATACFQIDTYAYPRRRLRWAALFDHVAVFHPGYDQEFRRKGHPGAFLLPHAIQREIFDGPELNRTFDIGWVGQSRGPLYSKRAALLEQLAHSFTMNDFSQRHDLRELADIYCRSRIVVNVGRDDYPQDANLRTFEAMASGALLVTSLPSELSDLGFVEGVHFAGYHEQQELFSLVRRFLKDDSALKSIAQAARQKVFQEHTYDSRVDALLERIHQGGKRHAAPARSRSESQVRLTYLDYYAAHGALKEAAGELSQIMRRNPAYAATGAALLARAFVKRYVKNRISVPSRSPADDSCGQVETEVR